MDELVNATALSLALRFHISSKEGYNLILRTVRAVAYGQGSIPSALKEEMNTGSLELGTLELKKVC